MARHFIKPFILVAALALTTPAVVSAASDGTSNTIMFAELHHPPVAVGFMDYTDDVCVVRATTCAAGGQEGEE